MWVVDVNKLPLQKKYFDALNYLILLQPFDC